MPILIQMIKCPNTGRGCQMKNISLKKFDSRVFKQSRRNKVP